MLRLRKTQAQFWMLQRLRKSRFYFLLGIYPIVGWKIKDETVYVAEGASNDTGTTIKWAQGIGKEINCRENSLWTQNNFV